MGKTNLSRLLLLFIILFVLPGLADDRFANSVQKAHLLYPPQQKTLDLQFGDIIFQTSNSGQSKAVQIATDSKYSHVGMVFNSGSDILILEAIQPVKLTPLKRWIDRGDDRHYVVKRLKNRKSLLTESAGKKMKIIGDQFLGKNYDIHFDWSDEKLYCSELVWKIYKRGAGIELGKLQKLSEFHLDDPIVQEILEERYGDNIPLDEKVISPAAIYNSDKLQLIFKN
ncbi:MAG: YiiX family permuted papain-like enzyme [Crocinitomicaceae bacterium]